LERTLSQVIINKLRASKTIVQFLRFASIGFLNTGLDFLLLNAISKALDIHQGWPLGAVDFVSFTAALIQSYLWNRTWTFGREEGIGFARNVMRLIQVGLLGVAAIVLVLVASSFAAPALVYVVILALYLGVESLLWRRYGFHMRVGQHEAHSFTIFLIVTAIGVAINVSLVTFVSVYLQLTGNPDLDKNIAKVIATAVSLFWNFTGYKIFVFKK
jgi:putative flippase GtrA